MEYHLINRSNNTVTLPREQYNKFERKLIYKTKKLNAIEKVINERDRRVYYTIEEKYTKIKNILRSDDNE